MKIQHTTIILTVMMIFGLTIMPTSTYADDFGAVFQNKTPPGLAEHTVEEDANASPELIAQKDEASDDGNTDLSGEELNNIVPAAGDEEHRDLEKADEDKRVQKTNNK